MPDLEPIQLSAQEVRQALLEEAKKYPRGRPWEPWEDDILHEFHDKLPHHVLADKLGRTIPMISHRLEMLGLTRKLGLQQPRTVVKRSSRGGEV